MTSIMEHKAVKSDKIKPWSLVVALIIWQIAAMIIDQKIILTSPFSVFLRLIEHASTSDFWLSIAFSLSRISLGFFLATFLGIILAILASRFDIVKDFLAPYMLTIKSVPVASFVILALIWFSSKNLSIFISFLMVLPIIYINIYEGIKNTDKNLLEMAKIFHMSKLKQVRYIYFFEIFPFLVSAMKVSLGLCFKAGIAAEVIGIPSNSIGENLYMAKIYLDTSSLFAWTVAIIIISLIFEKFFLYLLNLLSHYLERT